MKAARIVRVNEPLQVQEFQTPKPKDSQVLPYEILEYLPDVTKPEGLVSL
jgi:hypothetical protein